ncbi:MAG: zf-HC2 domain-containing protein, partial [Actinomycetota bacterium]
MKIDDHQHISELLRPLQRGELDAPTRRAVLEHLSGCPPCRLEAGAIEALAAEVDPLTAGERAEVRAAVLSATI